MELGAHTRKAGACLLGAIVIAATSGAARAQSEWLPGLLVTASRIGTTGIVGTSTTTITAEDIERSPAQSLPDILSREPGVQVQNLFGGVNGARSTVDMRGFGAAATSNTLLLINGRRVTDLDLVGFDLASIPRESIERIEITRGNSGAVLYGDGAVGGVINIITKGGAGLPNKARIDAGFGSFRQYESNGSVSGSQGPWSASVYGNAINSDGYRANNKYEQYNGVGDFRYTMPEGSVYLNLSADDQHIGLPGGRRVETINGKNSLITDRRGAATPFDWAEKQGMNATLGFTRIFAPGVELIVDGGVRHKNERGQFFDAGSPTPTRAVDTALTTSSVTPRLKIESSFAGMPTKGIGGFDYYNAEYGSDRPQALGAPPVHRFDLRQSNLAAYWQQTVTILPTTDIAGGARIQRTNIKAGDIFDANAPSAVPLTCFPGFGCFGDQAGVPLDKSETNHAWHLGLEHRVTENVALFGRMAQSFRVPNVDERVGMVTSLNGIPTTFDLRTQKSHDLEAGVRLKAGPVDVQWSIYDMHLTDEIHFRFAPNFEANNTNLDPTRRYGNETIVTWRLNEQMRIKGGAAYTRAVFREGLFAGNDVPLVSKWTGNAGLSWDIVPKSLVLDIVARYVGSRRMDNDQVNLQPLIPSHTTVDVRIGGEVDRFFWSFAVQNLFDVDYFDYSIASPFPFGFQSAIGTYNAYPQPGRTFLVKAGMTW